MSSRTFWKGPLTFTQAFWNYPDMFVNLMASLTCYKQGSDTINALLDLTGLAYLDADFNEKAVSVHIINKLN